MRQGAGWLVEIADATSDGAETRRTRRFHVGIPNKLEGVSAVRRRVPSAAGAKVVALSVLSRRTVYDVLRLKRGEIIELDPVQQKQHIDELLDEGLEETFPCSDPVAAGSFTSTEVRHAQHASYSH